MMFLYQNYLRKLLFAILCLNLGWFSFAQAITDCNAVTEISPAECWSVLKLYHSTNGANWTNNQGWNVTNTPCSWHGITCGNGGVIVIDADANNLSGTISNFSNFPNLGWLRYIGN